MLIHTLPPEIRDRLFTAGRPRVMNSLNYELTKDALEEIMGLPLDPKVEDFPLPVPDNPCTSVYDLFHHMTEELLGDRIAGIQDLLECPLSPPTTDGIVLSLSGWVRYSNGVHEAVECPVEDALVFDVETINWQPVMATAVSSEAWYIWLHPSLVDGSPLTNDLIPVGKNKTLIAHNAAFDLGFVAEAYQEDGGCMALCTQSLAIAMNGLGDAMTTKYLFAKKNQRQGKGYVPAWVDQSTTGSLVACYQFYTGKTWPEEGNKSLREIFIKARNVQPVIKALGTLVKYNLNDTARTHELARVQVPRFLNYYAENPVTLASQLLDSSALTALDPQWKVAWFKAEGTYQQKSKELDDLLYTQVDKVIESFMAGDLDLDDPWYSQLDWKPLSSGANKGKPKWYTQYGLHKGISLEKRPIPLILKVSWAGSPLVYDNVGGWGFVGEDDKWQRLPHPKGSKAKLGSPFCKDYAKLAEKGVVTSELEGVSDLLKLNASLAYWKAYRERLRDVRTHANPDKTRLLHVPETLWFGTVTLRQSNKVFLVLTSAQGNEHRVGSEFAHFQTTLGDDWCLVGADVDTQEVRIVALYGDKQATGILGSTALSQISFKGEKARGTDPHTLMAKVAQVTRDEAKAAGFRINYGGGRKTVAQANKTAHVDWSMEKCEEVADRMIAAKKGIRRNGYWVNGTDSHAHNFLGDVAAGKIDRIPGINRRIASSIDARYDNKKKPEAFTTRYNWGVQSAGSTWRHCFLMAVHYYAKKAGIKVRLAGCRHDEVWFHSPRETAHKLAAIMNLAHMLSWSLLCEGLGFHDMPYCLGGFSAINVDQCIRKEVNYGTTSLSGGVTYEPGYNLRPGDLEQEYEWLKGILNIH